MNVRGFVTFDTDSMPDQEIVEGSAPGKKLAELIRVELLKTGLNVDESVEDHEGYGWFFYYHTNEYPVFCMLQISDNWLLITEPETNSCMLFQF